MSDFEARAAFLLRLRERGIRDLGILRAIEAVPRSAFVLPRYAELAFKDIALPTDRGQTVPEPLFVGRLLAGSRLDPNARVLLVGVGAGYTTAILSHLVRDVVAVDRLSFFVEAARQRFRDLGRDNVETRCADGLLPQEGDLFDRVILCGKVEPFPQDLWQQVAPEGAVIYARETEPDREGAQILVRAEKLADGLGRQVVLGPCRFAPLRPGCRSMSDQVRS